MPILTKPAGLNARAGFLLPKGNPLSSVAVFPVPPEHLLEWWHDAYDHLLEAMNNDPDPLPIEQVIDHLQSGRLLLWVARREDKTIGALVTRITKGNDGTAALHILYLGGSQLAKWWQVLDDALTAAARQAGCTQITEQGRRGWLRQLPRAGYIELYTVMGKRL